MPRAAQEVEGPRSGFLCQIPAGQEHFEYFLTLKQEKTRPALIRWQLDCLGLDVAEDGG